MRVIALAKFTLKSYLQEKVLLVVMIFAALLMLSSYVLSPLAVGAQQKVVVDIGLAAISTTNRRTTFPDRSWNTPHASMVPSK